MQTENNGRQFRYMRPQGVPRKRRILVGVSLDHVSAAALRRAEALARPLGLELRVVHVLAPWTPPHPNEAPSGPADTRSHRSVVSLQRAAVKRWAQDELGMALQPEDIVIRIGDVAEQIRLAAVRSNAQLVVVGAGRVQHGHAGGTLPSQVIARCPCPVLVARGERDERTIVAATDLRDPSAPVVRAGSELARRLNRKLVIVHNAFGIGGRGVDYAIPRTMDGSVVSARLERLGTVARTFPAVAAATLTRDPVAADGILRVARAADGDIIVIGVRRDAGLTSQFVLAESSRSVLTIPLSA